MDSNSSEYKHSVESQRKENEFKIIKEEENLAEINKKFDFLDEDKILDDINHGLIKLNDNLCVNLDLDMQGENKNDIIDEIKYKNIGRKTKLGDLVIVYEGRESIKFLVLEKGKVYGNQFGQFKHEDMINKNFGERIYNSKKDKYFILILFITNLWERCTMRMTQILFNPDISLIISLLNLNKDSIIYESGTGSGCLSTNMLQILNNGKGHLYTFEFNKERQTKLNEMFKMLGFEKSVTCTHRDVVEKGFELEESELLHRSHKFCDGIFIDLPTPWLVLKSVKKHLRSGGAFVSFSPCIEQIEETMKALRQDDFINTKMYEIRYRSMGYSRTLKVKVPKLGTKRKFGEDFVFEEKDINVKMNKGDMKGHTGFLIYSTKL